MRICPKCNRQFPDNTLFCPDDGKALVDRAEGGDASASPQSSSGGSKPKPNPASRGRNEVDELEDTVLDTSMEDIQAAKQANQRAQQAQQQQQQQQQPGRTAQRSGQHNTGAQQRGSSPGAANTPQASRPSTPTPTRTDAPPPMTSSSGAQTSGQSLDPSDLVGERILGEYTITKKLGEGGMGAVYLATQNAIDQRIAIKVLHEDTAENEEQVQRFHREARVVSMLTHPNIIRVFIFGRTQSDLLYLAMEFVEGQELRKLIDRSMLDEMRVIKIMKQLCSGLSEAHDLGIIHRDLKPDNVLMTEWRGEEDFAKILDFGIAKLKQPDTPEAQKNLTQAGIVYGTPEYLSPEQAQALDLDHRTDIYSLGCILYELMTGKVPFREPTPVKILTAHVFNEVTPPSELAPNRVSPTMERIILKAMAKEQDDRFQNALEMFQALVAREQEIVREQNLGDGAGYVPGMELTGMYSAVDLQKQASDSTASPSPVPAPADTADVGASQVRNQLDSQPSAPSNTAPTAQATSADANSDGSSTRLVIYLLIAGIGMLFVVLLVTIGFLVLA